MAFTLQLIEGGTTTDLNDGSDTFLKTERGYTPRVGELDEETVTERATIGIAVDTVAELDSIRKEIIQRLYNAKEQQTNHARDKTYVHWQADGAASLWRSEILDGKIINMPDIFAVGWVVKHIEITVEWIRRNYWEGPEAQVPLTNDNGTDNTAGLTIYTCNDESGSSPTKRVNYCDIKAADVDGELPGAARFEITNTYATQQLGLVWIGQNILDPANHVWNYEGEDASGGAPAGDAGSSGGNYNLVTVTSGANFQDLLTWTIPSGDVDAAKGGMMKAIIRFSTASITTIWWRLHLEVASQTLWVSGRSKPDNAYSILFRDIVTFNFPPWLRGQTGQAEIDLVLEGQQESGGDLTAAIDALYLIPAEGWRCINTHDFVEDTERIVDDGIEGLVYVDDGSGSDKRSACTGYGNQIHLEPGILQRLYFLLHSNYGDAAHPNRKMSLKIYYRPRRYTV